MRNMSVLDRFLRYVSFDTQSNPTTGVHPSTAKQKVLGEALATELAQMGLQNAPHGRLWLCLRPSSRHPRL